MLMFIFEMLRDNLTMTWVESQFQIQKGEKEWNFVWNHLGLLIVFYRVVNFFSTSPINDMLGKVKKNRSLRLELQLMSSSAGGWPFPLVCQLGLG